MAIGPPIGSEKCADEKVFICNSSQTTAASHIGVRPVARPPTHRRPVPKVGGGSLT